MNGPPQLREVTQYVYSRHSNENETTHNADPRAPFGLQQPQTQSSKEKKVQAKRIRAYIGIAKAENKSINDIFSKTPTRQIYICNAGASTGAIYKETHALASQYGTVTRLMMVGLSAFALVEFETVESAIAARNGLDGMEWGGAASQKPRTLFVEFSHQDVSAFLGDGQHSLQLPNAVPLANLSPMSVCSLDELPTVVKSGQLEKGIVSGLLLVNDFITEAEEQTIMEYINGRPWDEVKRRHVQHYGFEFNYRVNDVDRQSPLSGKNATGTHIPEVFHPIMERLKILGALDKQAAEQEEEDANTPFTFPTPSSSSSSSSSTAPIKYRHYVPDQITVNKYQPGHGIPPHVDTHSAFTDIIISISLGSNIVMELLPTPSCQFLLNLPDEPVNVVLPPRSMLCLSGISRYGYTHAIIPRRTDRINNVLTPRQTRVSLTFRQLRHMSTLARRPVCRCKFTSDCDTKLMHTNSEAKTTSTSSSSSSAEVSSSSSSATDHLSFTSAFSSSSSSSSSVVSPVIPATSSLSSVESILASLPPPPKPLSPEIEACHRAACLADQNTYTDPATGYTVFTAIGLMRQRNGECCGNACRHCPYQHANVGVKKKKNYAQLSRRG